MTLRPRRRLASLPRSSPALAAGHLNYTFASTRNTDATSERWRYDRATSAGHCHSTIGTDRGAFLGPGAVMAQRATTSSAVSVGHRARHAKMCVLGSVLPV